MAEQEETIGSRISSLREYRGWTQKQLAERAGISVTFLSDVENDKPKSVSADVLFRLAGALGSTLDYLMTGRGPSTRQEETISIPPALTAAAEELGWSYKDTVSLLQAERAVVARRTRTGAAVARKELSKEDWISLHRTLIADNG
jgi:transcriptional regulator with XRE-family HTH domain